MWKVEVKQAYMSEYDYEREQTAVFKASSLEEVGKIVDMFREYDPFLDTICDMFREYGIGKIDFSITQDHEEKEA